MNAKLQKSIEKFLAVRSKGMMGGWAHVGEKDIEQISAILTQLLALKYEADADGDLPIEYDLVDRTQFERVHYFPIPYQKSEEDCKVALDLAVVNNGIATRTLDGLWKTLRRKQAAKVKWSEEKQEPK